MNDVTKAAFLDELTKISGFGGVLDTMRKYEDPIEVAGLSALALPNLDSMRARHKAHAAGIEDPTDRTLDKYRLIKSKYHDPIEAGGLGILTAPLLGHRVH